MPEFAWDLSQECCNLCFPEILPSSSQNCRTGRHPEVSHAVNSFQSIWMNTDLRSRNLNQCPPVRFATASGQLSSDAFVQFAPHWIHRVDPPPIQTKRLIHRPRLRGGKDVVPPNSPGGSPVPARRTGPVTKSVLHRWRRGRRRKWLVRTFRRSWRCHV